MRIKQFIANKIHDVKKGGGGRSVPSVIMMLIFPRIVWACPLTDTMNTFKLMFENVIFCAIFIH